MNTTVDRTRYGAVLFDLDGMTTPTAEIHTRATAHPFARRDSTPAVDLTDVDGTPRDDGVRSLSASRGVDRGGNGQALADAGADLVVDDLADTSATHVQSGPDRADT